MFFANLPRNVLEMLEVESGLRPTLILTKLVLFESISSISSSFLGRFVKNIGFLAFLGF